MIDAYLIICYECGEISDIAEIQCFYCGQYYNMPRMTKPLRRPTESWVTINDTRRFIQNKGAVGIDSIPVGRSVTVIRGRRNYIEKKLTNSELKRRKQKMIQAIAKLNL